MFKIENDNEERSPEAEENKLYIPPHRRRQIERDTTNANTNKFAQGFTRHAKLRQKQSNIKQKTLREALQSGEKLEHPESDIYIDEKTQVVLTKDGTVITVLDNKRNTQFDLLSKTKTREQALIRKARLKNNDRAMCELAELYLSGDLGNRDVESARQWLLKAARNGKGNSHAMCLLAKMYEGSDLGTPNPQIAWEWMENAARQNNKYALAIVGQHYLRQYRDMIQDKTTDECLKAKVISKAKYFFERGANKGSTCAMWHLAKMYEEGCFGEKNLTKAIEIYVKAAKLGSFNSLMTLKQFCEEEKLSPETFEAILDETSMLIARTSSGLAVEIGLEQIKGRLGKNPQRGFQMLEQAAQHRNEDAIRLLIEFYKNGKGCESNLERAQYWFQQLIVLYREAAEQGNVNAMCNLGYSFLKGDLGKIDFEEAEKHFINAAKTGDIKSLFRLGILYIKGRLGNKDPAEGILWIHKAIEESTSCVLSGDVEAAVFLAYIYRCKGLVVKNYQKASEWLLFAADKGHVESKINFGKLQLKKQFNQENVSNAIDLLEKTLCEIPLELQSRARRILGDLYSKNNAYEKAFIRYKQAAKFGNSKAMLRLGKIFQSGTLHEINLSQAIKCYKLSTVRGNPKALDCLIKICQASELPSELKIAIESFLKKYQTHNRYSNKVTMCYEKGKHYQEGSIGEAKDSIQAAFWYRKAIKYKHAESLFALANLYESGALGEKVCPVAIQYYKRAARKNHGESIKSLIRIYEGGFLVQANPDKVNKLKIKESQLNLPLINRI